MCHLSFGVWCLYFVDEIALVPGARGSDPAILSAAVTLSQSSPPVAVAGSSGITSSSNEVVAAAPSSAISESEVVNQFTPGILSPAAFKTSGCVSAPSIGHAIRQARNCF